MQHRSVGPTGAKQPTFRQSPRWFLEVRGHRVPNGVRMKRSGKSQRSFGLEPLHVVRLVTLDNDHTPSFLETDHLAYRLPNLDQLVAETGRKVLTISEFVDRRCDLALGRRALRPTRCQSLDVSEYWVLQIGVIQEEY